MPPPPPLGHDLRAAGLMSSGRSFRQPSQGARSHTSMPSPPAIDQDARAPDLHHLGSRRSSQGGREMILHPEYQHGSRKASRGGREVIPYQSSRHPSSLALQSQGRAGSFRHAGHGHCGYPLHPSRGSSHRHTHGFDGPGEEAWGDVGQVQQQLQLQTQHQPQQQDHTNWPFARFGRNGRGFQRILKAFPFSRYGGGNL
jgi:hypothetical protein